MAFDNLCAPLRDTVRLEDDKNATVKEQVAKFLCMWAHNVSNQTMSFFFCRFSETISRHFHEVLRAIISLEDEFLRQPNNRVDVPQKIVNSQKFYPYFKVRILN